MHGVLFVSYIYFAVEVAINLKKCRLVLQNPGCSLYTFGVLL